MRRFAEAGRIVYFAFALFVPSYIDLSTRGGALPRRVPNSSSTGRGSECADWRWRIAWFSAEVSLPTWGIY